jgi:hypothetical protein
MLSNRKSRERGAALVESLILASTLVVGLLALIYFRDLYITQLRVQRLARASAVAHSMAACMANSPELWLDLDLDVYQSNTPLQEQMPAAGSARSRARPVNPAQARRARRFVESSGTGTSSGEGFLNPVTTTDVSGSVGASSADTVFQGDGQALSFVGCGDAVKQERYPDLVDKLTEELTALFGEAFAP